MTTLSPQQIAQLAASAGFTNSPGTYGGKGLTWAVAVALAESGGRTDAVSPPNHDGSHDVGLWQINSKAHPAESATATDPASCARSAYAISSGGRNFSPWSTLGNGTAGAQLGRAALAVGGAAGSTAQPVTDLTPGFNLPDLTPGFNLPSPGDLLSPITSLAKAAAATVSLELKTYAWLGNPHNWLRIAQVAGGAVLVVVAIKGLAGADAGAASDLAGGAVRAGSHVTGAISKTAKVAAVAAAA